MKYKLVLENGMVFHGNNFGSTETKVGEICFVTSMVGYQDPSYFGKIVCMSYPLIGNYGLTDEDYDFKNIHVLGYVVKENNDLPSNFRSTRTLSDAMEENRVTGIEDIDTRQIVRIIRDLGLMKAMITEDDRNHEECMNIINNTSIDENPLDKVSCKKIWYSRTANPLYTIVVVDLGIKTSLVKLFNSYGLNVVVVPFNSSYEDIIKLKPNGIVFSHGPGNPAKMDNVINLVKSLKGKYPILGLGLGSEIIALGYGSNVEKMKHGHQGSNHPVKNVKTNKIEITSQNHFYNIISSGKEKYEITHVNILDNDIEGFEDKKNKVIGIQYLVQESLQNEDIINRFIELMK